MTIFVNNLEYYSKMFSNKSLTRCITDGVPSRILTSANLPK